MAEIGAALGSDSCILKVTMLKDARRVHPNFITEIIDRDLKEKTYKEIVTRFPPEPNGYAHIGHVIASFVNFGLALDYGGRCHLRMDDTNPETERPEYVESIVSDMRWLGWDWGVHLYYASDYFEQFHACALRLIHKGLAYVDSLSDIEIHNYRGTIDTPGKPSPYRERSVEENLDLFERMKKGEFPNGAHVLRAKIDLSHPNMKLRDPVLYRILHVPHYRQGAQWCIYPLYDFAHPLSDAIEGVTHSLCSLEFADNRAIYDWLLDHLWEKPRPHQYEFGRRSLEYTVVSKRKLIKLVDGGHVAGWDDPRMPTLAGLRRRGVLPRAIVQFASQVSISRTNRTVDLALLEHHIRDDLNTESPRVLAVIRPLKVVLTNHPEEPQTLEASYWPHDIPKEGFRPLVFSRELYIESDDFMEEPSKGFRRLSPGSRVRLRHAHVIECQEVIKDSSGQVIELRCVYLPETLGRDPLEGPKPKSVIHWVSAEDAKPAEFRLYDRLFTVSEPDEHEEGKDFSAFLNPQSLTACQGYVESSVLNDSPETRYQFERLGYFWQDPTDSRKEGLVFNRIVTLRDPWGRAQSAEPVDEKPKREKALQPQEVRVQSHSPEEQSRIDHYMALGITQNEASILAREAALRAYLERVLALGGHPVILAHWLTNDLTTAVRDGLIERLDAQVLGNLSQRVHRGEVSKGLAKSVLLETLETHGNLDEYLTRKTSEQISDPSVVGALVKAVMDTYPDKVLSYRQGKTTLLGFFVGQVMRASQGRIDPQLLNRVAEEELGHHSDDKN